MATKKEFTIEELQQQCEEAKKNFEHLNALIEQKKKEEAELKEAKLAKEKEARKKEVDESIAHTKNLIQAYINDYGIYSFTSSNDDEVFNSRFWNWIY
jgi:hypothetical protein